MNATNVSKIEKLRQREAALKAAIAEEKVRQQKAKERVEVRELPVSAKLSSDMPGNRRNLG